MTRSDGTSNFIQRANYDPTNDCFPKDTPIGKRLTGFAAGVDSSKALYNVQAFWLLYASCYVSNAISLDLTPISLRT